MAEDQKAKEKAKKQPATQAKVEATNIVHIAGKDVNAGYDLIHALDEIKGIGFNLASALARAFASSQGIPYTTTIGSLSEQQLQALEQMIKEPGKYGIPGYMLNHRKDAETGLDLHYVGTDLTVRTRQDIEAQIKLGTWRGFRHQYGQRVRGQRSRSTGRTGPTVGVIKKKAEEEAKKAEEAGKQQKGQASAK
ncbi:MAG: 30S ribosomal protein S13 [Candidatus Micrarchaeia archaeon]